MTHGMNSIYIILDLLFVTGVPVRLYHLVHPLTAGVVYIVFTLIYDVAGGNVLSFLILYILLKNIQKILSCFLRISPLKLTYLSNVRRLKYYKKASQFFVLTRVNYFQGWEAWPHAHLNEKLKSINIC